MLQELKSTHIPHYLEAAAMLFRVVEQRKELERQEAALKALFKDGFPQGGTVKAGKYQVTVARKAKTSLDRDRLLKLIGADGVKALEKKSPYLEVTVMEEALPLPN